MSFQRFDLVQSGECTRLLTVVMVVSQRTSSFFDFCHRELTVHSFGVEFHFVAGLYAIEHRWLFCRKDHRHSLIHSKFDDRTMFDGDLVCRLIDPGHFAIGDTIYTGGRRISYPGIPSFSPEKFAYLRNPNPSTYKKFQKVGTSLTYYLVILRSAAVPGGTVLCSVAGTAVLCRVVLNCIVLYCAVSSGHCANQIPSNPIALLLHRD